MMDFSIDLNMQRPNSSVKVGNCWSNYTSGLFIVVKACVEPATLFGWADCRRIVHEYALDSPEQHSPGLEFSFPFFKMSCPIKAK